MTGHSGGVFRVGIKASPYGGSPKGKLTEGFQLNVFWDACGTANRCVLVSELIWLMKDLTKKTLTELESDDWGPPDFESSLVVASKTDV